MNANNPINPDGRTLKEIAYDMNILLVEDDTILLEQLKLFLTRFFCSVDTALNGVEALQKYGTKQYDLILTDLTMPQMDGIELSRKIKSLNDAQHIIVLSAHSESEKLIELINIGVESFLLKPVDVDMMIKRLTKSIQALYDHKMFLYFGNILEETNKELKERNMELEETLNELTLAKISIKKQAESLKEPAPVLTAKISASEFHALYSFELEDVNENLQEIEDMFNLMIISSEQGVTQNTLQKLIVVFRDFLQELEMLPQFRALAYAMQQLSISVESLDDFSKLKIIMPMVASLFDNLEIWRKGIFYYKNAEDIHSMDEMLMNEISNLENFFNH